ncbi:unnamed protein product, partial [marine sediment metagenome]
MTVELVKATRLMTQTEHADWLVNERINQRGVKIDRELAQLAVRYAGQEQKEISKKLAALTDWTITSHTQTARIRDWLKDRLMLIQDARKLMLVEKDGEQKWSVDKNVRAQLMALHGLPLDVQELLKLTDDGNRSSVAKFQRMLDMADPEDDRVRGAFIYAGAGQTGRFSSKGLQLHNSPRKCLTPAETEDIRGLMKCGEVIPDVMDTLAKLLRPALIPEKGNVFVVGDWSAIEARVLPWLANTKGSEKVLDVFRSGEDIYMHTAKEMNLDDRFIGKVATLALGYQGSVGAFQNMAKIYGLEMSDTEAKVIVDRWRKANQWAKTLWAKCDTAAKEAVRKPGTYHEAGRLRYWCHGETLFCALPGGYSIQYPLVKIDQETDSKFGSREVVSYAKASITPAADAEEWPRHSLYGGILVENACQAVAANILKNSLQQLDDVVLHCHDEIGIEVPERLATDAALNLQKVM